MNGDRRGSERRGEMNRERREGREEGKGGRRGREGGEGGRGRREGGGGEGREEGVGEGERREEGVGGGRRETENKSVVSRKRGESESKRQRSILCHSLCRDSVHFTTQSEICGVYLTNW